MNIQDKTKEELINELQELKQAHDALRVSYEADIIEKKQAIEALQASEEKMHSIYRVAPTGIGVVVNRMLKDVNLRACEMTGYTREELLGKSARILYPTQEDYEFVGKNKYDQIRAKGTGEVETRWQKKNGTIIHVLLASTPIDLNDQSQGVIFTALDITERKKAEQALQESEEKFRSLANSAKVMISIVADSGGGKYLYVNDEWQHVMGYSKDEVINIRPIDNVAPEDRQMVLDYAAKRIEGKPSPSNYDLRIITRSGEMKYLDFSATTLKFGNQKVILTSAIDITERKKTEEALRQREEMMRTSQSVAHICSYSTNLDVNELEKSFWVCSPEFYTIFGIDESYPHTIEGWTNFIHPDYRDEIVAYHESVVKEKKSFNREYKIIRINDGAERWVHGTGELEFDKKGKPVRMHGAIQDITDRKKFELTLQKNEEILNETQKISKIGGWEWDVEKEIMTWTDEVYRIHDIDSHEKLKGHELITWGINCYLPNYRNKIAGAFKQCVEDGKPYDMELPFTSATGRSLWVRTTAKPIKEKGNIVRVIGNIMDVTDRKLAEVEKAKQEKIMAQAEELAGIGSWEWDIINDTWFLSDNWIKIHGLVNYQPNSSKLNTSQLISIAHPEDRPYIEEAFAKAVENGEPYNIQHRIIRQDTGEIRYIYAKGIVEYDDSEKKKTLIGAAQDITESKLADENIRQSQQLLQNISDNMFDLVALTDLEGNYTFAGASYKILGYETSKLIGTNVFEYVHPDDLPEIMATFNEFIANKQKTAKTEYRHRRADGSYLWFETIGRYIFDNIGNPEQILFNSRDITDRRKSDNALRESDERFRMLAMLAPVGIVITDENQNPAYVSPVFTKIFGYTIHDIPTVNHWFLLAYPEENTRNKIKQVWFEFSERVKKETGDTSPLEYPVHCKNGNIKQIEFRLAISGGVNVITFTDITERKKAEKIHKELEIAQKTARFKQNFLANMSHEIRTPLTGVLGMIEIMEQTPLTPDQKDYLDTIKISGENLREIINQVLDYSKIEAGKITLHPHVFEFASLPLGARSLYKNNVKTGVKFHNTIDPNIPLWMEADNARLAQILNNLVSNAVKFTSRGVISFQSSLVSSGPINGQVIIKVEVTDTGPGIPEDLQKMLFIPFSQVEAIDTRTFEGTGLGLSICKQLVEMMGGKIGVISEEGKGSTFWFTFPAQIAQKTPLAIQKKDAPVFSKKLNILLAEDKLVNQKVVKLMLTSMGHEVCIAKNGQEVIELYQPGQFDLILMDIQMPVMDGIAATQKLKEKYKNLPPIVGLSANAFEGDRQKYMELGMDEYLTKPVKADDFKNLVNKWFIEGDLLSYL